MSIKSATKLSVTRRNAVEMLTTDWFVYNLKLITLYQHGEFVYSQNTHLLFVYCSVFSMFQHKFFGGWTQFQGWLEFLLPD